MAADLDQRSGHHADHMVEKPASLDRITKIEIGRHRAADALYPAAVIPAKNPRRESLDFNSSFTNDCMACSFSGSAGVHRTSKIASAAYPPEAAPGFVFYYIR